MIELTPRQEYAVLGLCIMGVWLTLGVAWDSWRARRKRRRSRT